MGIGSLQRRSMSINIHSSSLSRGPSHQYSTPQVAFPPANYGHKLVSTRSMEHNCTLSLLLV